MIFIDVCPRYQYVVLVSPGFQRCGFSMSNSYIVAYFCADH